MDTWSIKDHSSGRLNKDLVGTVLVFPVLLTELVHKCLQQQGSNPEDVAGICCWQEVKKVDLPKIFLV